MSLRYEWRSKEEWENVLLTIDAETNTILRVQTAEPVLLTDFLNEMEDLGGFEAASIEITHADPEAWGEIVLVRSDEGDVLEVNPERYWNRVVHLFRERGGDPHLWSAHH